MTAARQILPWLLLPVLLWGCRATPVPGPQGAPEPVLFADSGALAYLLAGDTTVVDEYVRTTNRLTGKLRIFPREPGGSSVRASYCVYYSASGLADSAALSIEQISPEGRVEPERRRWQAIFHEEGIVESELAGGRTFEAAVGPDALPLFGPSIAMIESILRRSRSLSVAVIPVFHLAAAARVDTARIQWRGDAADLTIDGVTTRYQLDGEGRLLSGESLSEELRAVRIR